MSTYIKLTVDKKTLQNLVLEHLENILGPENPIQLSDIHIQTKSKQNYKSEWETADFRAETDITKE